MFLFVYYNCCNIPESFRNLLSFGVRRFCVTEENRFAEDFKDLLSPPIHLADDLLRRLFKTTKYVFSMAGFSPFFSMQYLKIYIKLPMILKSSILSKFVKANINTYRIIVIVIITWMKWTLQFIAQFIL